MSRPSAQRTSVLPDAITLGRGDPPQLVTREVFPLAEAIAEVRARSAARRARADADAQWFPSD